MKALILRGSSRNDGDTIALRDLIVSETNWDSLDLNDYSFSYYDYQHENRNDDFIPMMKTIIESYDTLLFVTPVYWYSMSGIMKVFFDRLTDLITIEKELGRKLRGKQMAVVSTSNGNNLGDDFWLPFKATSDYLGMNYLGDLHTYTEGEDRKESIGAFVENIYAK
jgi:multimeric flavodoxin WrbA